MNNNSNMVYRLLVIHTFISPISKSQVKEGTILVESEYEDTIRKIHSMLLPEFKDNCKIVKINDIN